MAKAPVRMMPSLLETYCLDIMCIILPGKTHNVGLKWMNAQLESIVILRNIPLHLAATLKAHTEERHLPMTGLLAETRTLHGQDNRRILSLARDGDSRYGRLYYRAWATVRAAPLPW